MQLKAVARDTYRQMRSIPKKYVLIGGLLLLVLLYALIFRERTLAYSYDGVTCDRQTVFLPKLLQQSGSDDYTLTISGGFVLGGYPIISTSICASPNESPQQATESVATLSPFGSIVARLSYKVTVPPAPQLQLAALDKPISAIKPLQIPLSSVDTTFEYSVVQENATAKCESRQKALSCNIEALKLKQGQKYDISLDKTFKSQSVAKVARTVTTLSPVSVTKSSIDNDATVYEKPTQISFKTDKSLRDAKFTVTTKGEEATVIPSATSIKDTQVTLTFENELPRSREFSVQATTLEAVDGSTLEVPYALNFKTSGGPTVTNVSVGVTGVAVDAAIVLTFDQELSTDQPIDGIVTVKGAAATITKQAETITVQLNNVEKCADVVISVAKAIMSKHDIAQTEDWSRSQRTSCHTSSVVGYSTQGRAITAYEFGSGTRTILFVGAIHGNEYSTYSLMQRWFAELEARAKEIPGDKRIVIVPQINPDGVASGSRVNANNVDLNRNFGTSDWQKDITTVGNQPFKGGGGETAMSEPETKVMAALAGRLRPELTLSYHSIGGLLAANQAGRSSILASTYSQLSGYRNTTGQTSSTFEYSISGTWDDYLAERLGAASILIELGSHSYHQFERNQAAMWAMVKS